MRLISVYLAAVAAANGFPPRVASLLTRYAAFTGTEIEAVRRGERIVHPIPTDRQEEVAFAGATRLTISVSEYLNRLRAGTLYRPGENVLRIGRFSETPGIADLRNLHFESFDLKDGSSVESNQRALLARIEEYEKAGTIAVGPFGSTPVSVDKTTAFEPLVREAGYLRERFPHAWEYLLRYPQAPSRGRDDFYLWTQLTFGFRPLTRVAQVAIWDEGNEAVVVTKQIYATRYFETSFQIDHLIADGSGLFLVTLNYGRSDLLQGLTGKLIRPVVVSRTVSLASKTLDQARKDLQAND